MSQEYRDRAHECALHPSETPYRHLGSRMFAPPVPIVHRDEEYDEGGFATLLSMQERHFWYQGRHRFLLHAVRAQLRQHPEATRSAVDLGGGCGGWIKYLETHAPGLFGELALADSSRKALELARTRVGLANPCYQADLMDLRWRQRWDAVFLLDVLEHIPEQEQALAEIQAALRPGGLLFLTVPAFMFFWSYNDEASGHQRRYTRADFVRLAAQTGYKLLRSRYFMFFLSPLLFLSRLRRKHCEGMSADELRQQCQKEHTPPPAVINWTLARIFDLETPVGYHLPFPWGSSVFVVLQKAS